MSPTYTLEQLIAIAQMTSDDKLLKAVVEAAYALGAFNAAKQIGEKFPWRTQ